MSFHSGLCCQSNDRNYLSYAVFVNGNFCNDSKQATADDFLFMGFGNPRNTSNLIRSKVAPAFIDQFPGLNTLGISMTGIDFAPILIAVEGTLLVGFVTSNQLNNILFTKVLYKGDVFLFQNGLIHFPLNIGNPYALAFASLSSQNPGVITIANAVFGAKPPICADVLTKAFQVDKRMVGSLQAPYWYDDNN
ncbi:germin-like protein subfamily 1 member 13 [Rhodamnia argentea]|uniref:Germin-like protein n=1 Tax=Rhodamnia argentea TaxID=178133 RepID=A0ABM3HBP8_9MYRT|nr:germin-like protein subfamily 1 member 13 [Rhodamnia argentea]